MAGQWVRVIRKEEEEGGVLEFGSELVTFKHGSIALLARASTGASTSLVVKLEMMEECFPELRQSKKWNDKLAETILSFNKSFKEDNSLTKLFR